LRKTLSWYWREVFVNCIKPIRETRLDPWPLVELDIMNIEGDVWMTFLEETQCLLGEEIYE